MRVVRAQSRGTCPECLEPINLGDEILQADKPQTPGRAWQHASCATGIEANFADTNWPERGQQDEGPIKDPMRYHFRCGTCGSRVNKIGVDKCAGCIQKDLEKEAN